MIRRLTVDDWQEYKRLRLLALQTDPDVFFYSYEEVSKWTDGGFQSEIYPSKDGIYGYWGYFDGDVLVGYVSLIRSYFAKQSHVGDLCNLYVDPKYRGRGIATDIVRALLAYVRDATTLEILNLSVMAPNQPAIRLYESVGFTRAGIKRKSLKVGEQFIDEVLMQLDLSPDK